MGDGTVVPSFLLRQYSNHYATLSDVALRTGVVTAIYPPTSKKNSNKKYVEYDVLVRYSDSGGPETSTTYPRVRLASMFGGIADYMSWVPRLQIADTKATTSTGSEVLLMCVDGNTRHAYIIGGVPHSKPSKTDSDTGVHLNFEYNGILVNINSKGDLELIRKGATSADGNVLKDQRDNSGATIIFDSAGDIALGFTGFTEENSRDLPWLRMSKPDNTLGLFCKRQMNITTEDWLVVKTTNLIINPDGEGFNQSFLRGSEYREQQAAFHRSLKIQLPVLITALTAASTAIITAAGLNAIPIGGGAAAAAPFALAGAQLAVASSAAVEVFVALQVFEALAARYLSTSHTFKD